MIDTITQIIRILLGGMLVLFIPGYLLSLILFKKGIDRLERFVLSVVLSVCIDVFVGLSLGLNEGVASITGGLTGFNVWISLTSISVVFFLVYECQKSVDI